MLCLKVEPIYNHKLYAWYKMWWLILIVALLVEPCSIGTGVPDAERRLEGDGLAGGDAGYYVGISGLSLHSPRYSSQLLLAIL